MPGKEKKLILLDNFGYKMANSDKTFNKRALTIKEVSEYACVSRSTVENWLVKGVLPFEELPSRGEGSYCFRRIRKTDLDNFLNQFYQKHSIQKSNNKKSKELFLLPRNT